MPLLPKLATPADVGYCEDRAVLLHPRQDGRAEERVDRNREAAVAYLSRVVTIDPPRESHRIGELTVL